MDRRQQAGARYDERVREIWADIPQELETRKAWAIARPGMAEARRQAEAELAAAEDRAPGTPHPDPRLASRGWHVVRTGIYVRRQAVEHAEPEVEAAS